MNVVVLFCVMKLQLVKLHIVYIFCFVFDTKSELPWNMDLS
jgi:hypothetical protein